ncbi:proline reductase cluster protein PrdD [Lactonifactor sp. BIOML-A3]|uniref:proline reductase cluster protein PrdD n=1 Tax=unclassified Lactonifactor TaxID=2636670 RepID=UPI0012AFAD41|nr:MULTISPECIES: proline reductase cluster protein PrdD [unclassified Lactonifactor]MSA03457.1 proline reductase cluster protein PrdD [Lactonifactor sp. BIOML-A5]MSA10551.1 proline reductase cluster protein PrdD [Lactonifactor sp. BIOML-A4]MSA15077.1 proline reductase cluster protein PrdD [Lactonifactor sp. BIOML-A3]MSA17236.1 proline reductase cluster protein PrdD [Lactonifactor sp. BIOML-A2]MSA40128.1 proline reductase cluster protein PrdD [Lactonifactor sp. BIOML-A1]
MEEVILRRLVIKAFHINQVIFGEKPRIDPSGTLIIARDFLPSLTESEPLIEKIDMEIISPDARERWTNTIMDVIPVSAKVLGKMGEGITHTLTGVRVLLTGVDADGVQIAEFGSSEGCLKEQIFYGRPGTPDNNDILISFNVTLAPKAGASRPGPTAAHRACDVFCQILRDELKKMNGNLCTERHEYFDKSRPGKKRVVLIKQVAGQGAMYDTCLFPREPSGFKGGRSIIDMGNLPVLITPNEYRDGAIRAMY